MLNHQPVLDQEVQEAPKVCHIPWKKSMANLNTGATFAINYLVNCQIWKFTIVHILANDLTNVNVAINLLLNWLIRTNMLWYIPVSKNSDSKFQNNDFLIYRGVHRNCHTLVFKSSWSILRLHGRVMSYRNGNFVRFQNM